MQTSFLREDDFSRDPLTEFRKWFAAATASGEKLPEAMALATVGDNGRPSNRVVLLKAADESGFAFYTNLGSRKARELDEHPQAAGVFWWRNLDRQVRVEGTIEPLSALEADAYFATRPRGSQLGAWASRQSDPIASREVLEAKYADYERQFEGREVPRPAFWGGYRIIPDCYEFWQSQGDRLHDRFEYILEAGVWTLRRLSP